MKKAASLLLFATRLEKLDQRLEAHERALSSLVSAAQGDQQRPSVADLISITAEIATLLE